MKVSHNTEHLLLAKRPTTMTSMNNPNKPLQLQILIASFRGYYNDNHQGGYAQDGYYDQNAYQGDEYYDNQYYDQAQGGQQQGYGQDG
jgi:hypothetical protein